MTCFAQIILDRWESVRGSLLLLAVSYCIAISIRGPDVIAHSRMSMLLASVISLDHLDPDLFGTISGIKTARANRVEALLLSYKGM